MSSEKSVSELFIVPSSASARRRPLVETLLTAESRLRTHPRGAALLAMASFAAIAGAKFLIHAEVSLSISFALPVFLSAYGVGLVAGLTMAVAGSMLWLSDAVTTAPAAADVAYLFASRLFTNATLAVLANLAAHAVRARERHLEVEQTLTNLRRDLVAAFSHDVRTPLAAIVGYAHILHNEILGEEHRKMLAAMLTNARHVDGLVSDILGVEQSSSGVGLQVSAFDAAPLLSVLATELDPVAESRALQLRWEVEPGTPEFCTDRGKLVSIVRNLVGNALKFTREGAVIVRIGYDKAAGVHRIEVADSGRGIAPESLSEIFGRFRHGLDSQSGFGFGLFIVKRFVEVLRGTVAVESEVGRGTRFLVCLPRLSEGSHMSARSKQSEDEERSGDGTGARRQGEQ